MSNTVLKWIIIYLSAIYIGFFAGILLYQLAN